MAKRRFTIPTFIEGEEVGGVLIGKWFEPAMTDEILGPKIEIEKDKGKFFEIPQNPQKGKILGIKYNGGIVQFPNAANMKENTYRLPHFFWIVLRLMPLLLGVFRGYEVIGLWHSHPPGHPDISKEDEESIERYMKQSGQDKMLIGIVCNKQMYLTIKRNDTQKKNWATLLKGKK